MHMISIQKKQIYSTFLPQNKNFQSKTEHNFRTQHDFHLDKTKFPLVLCQNAFQHSFELYFMFYIAED